MLLVVVIETEMLSFNETTWLIVRFNLLTGCPQAKTCTILIRGGAEQFMEETERSLQDAIMIVRRTTKNDAVVAGAYCSSVCLFGYSIKESIYKNNCIHV